MIFLHYLCNRRVLVGSGLCDEYYFPLPHSLPLPRVDALDVRKNIAAGDKSFIKQKICHPAGGLCVGIGYVDISEFAHNTGAGGIGPPTVVLETTVLPLN